MEPESTPPGDPAPKVPAGEPQDPPQGDPKDELLGENGKKALESERTRANNAEKQARDLKTQLEDNTSKIDGILSALGIKDKDVDPDALARDLATERSTRSALAVENAVLRLAGRNGADPEALVDSRSFMEEVGKLDPADSDFSTRLTDAIKAKVDQSPSFRVQQVKQKPSLKPLKSGTTGTETPDRDPKAAAAEALRQLRNGG